MCVLLAALRRATHMPKTVSGARAGAGISGLHHAKALCHLRPGGAALVVGSLNFTTSSKATSERGSNSRSRTTRSWPAWRNFERVAAEAISLDEAAARRPALQKSSSSQDQAAPRAAAASQTVPAGIE